MFRTLVKLSLTWVGVVCLLFSIPVFSQVESVEEAEAAYLLGQGDKISIQVFDEPDLTMTAQVGASGVINYSYLGDIVVAGKTAQQLENDITSLLQDGYLVNPSVNVAITEFRPFFINGEVRSPGGYAYQPGLTLDKAIALAGGLTDRASQRKMYIVKAISENQESEKARMQTKIAPGDIITIKEGFF
jgi:polysaccharide export outer membrane protein